MPIWVLGFTKGFARRYGRHWKGIREYHKTEDVMHVKRLLGRRSIQSTMIYINPEQAVFATENDEFNVKAAGNLEEACKLIEVGFKYDTDMDGKKTIQKEEIETMLG